MPRPNQPAPRPEKPPVKRLYLITKSADGQKSFWSKVGAGFVNSDGSINLLIDFMPGVSLQLRDPKPEDDE
jgi:hypothetical protein